MTATGNELKTKVLLAVGVAAALAMASCAKDEKIDPLAGGGGLAGSWVSSDGVFTAELADGSFVSIANDTGETLSEGNYVVSSATAVVLSWRGRLSGQENTANCNRPGPNTLNCVDAAGRSFTLNKRGA